MSERYIRLQEIIIETCLLNAPVEIEKGALLLDTQTDVVLLQLRLNILMLGIGEISYVNLNIETLDDAGNDIPNLKPFDNTFRDVNLLGTKSFGEKTPIVLDSRVRRVKVEIAKITFADGNSWLPTGKKLHPPEQKSINSISTDLREQIDRDTDSISSEIKERINFFPQQLDECWLCVCGRPNDHQITNCCRCNIEKNWMFENINEEKIQKNLDSYNEQIRIFNEGKKARSIKRKEQLRRASIILVGIGLISLFFFYFVLPVIKYSQASSYLNNKDYASAIKGFESLGEYKDSKEMISEVNYQKAIDLFSNRQFLESKNYFNDLGNYKDSIIFIKEANYYMAIDLLNNHDYLGAYNILAYLNYKDSAELAQQIEYKLPGWYIKGNMIKDSFSLFEPFTVLFTVVGGQPDESVNLTAFCTLPNGWEMSQNISTEAKTNDSFSFSCSYAEPLLGKTGTGKIEIKDNSSGEILANYSFLIH